MTTRSEWWNDYHRGGWWCAEDASVECLKGKTLSLVKVLGGWVCKPDAIAFETTEGERFVMYHYQDCCESVYIESIVGDLEDLVGSPVLMAEANSNQESGCCDSTTWTFYKFATHKGYVDIRWCGSSNGYYSESVDFVKLGE